MQHTARVSCFGLLGTKKKYFQPKGSQHQHFIPLPPRYEFAGEPEATVLATSGVKLHQQQMLFKCLGEV